MTVAEHHPKNRRTALILGGVVVGMFGFGFALVPLYNLFCQVTGIQSLDVRQQAASSRPAETDEPLPISGHRVVLKLDAIRQGNLPWIIEPVQRRLQVTTGKYYTATYRVTNNSTRPFTARALFSLTPWQATSYLHKTECFCFTEQTLQPGQQKDMALRFRIDESLPQEIRSLTLSYTFLPVASG